MIRGIFQKPKNSEKYRMGCGSSLSEPDEPYVVVVFGATGYLGGAVARRLLEEPFRYRVRCITRRSSGEKAKRLAELGAVIVIADLDEPPSLAKALDGADFVFLTTHFWEDKSKEKEIVRGLNAIDACVTAGVKHVIFNGSENIKKHIGKECGHLDSKAAIEEYIKEVDTGGGGGEEDQLAENGDKLAENGLSYTIVRLPFWYENFASIFKPHKIKHGVFALPLPLEGGTIDAMSVDDAGECIYEILLRYKQYTNKIVGLTADRLSMDSMLESFNKHIGNRKFKDPKIRIKDYEKFTFAGAQDLASMFEFYCKGIAQRDAKLTKKLYPRALTFDKWLSKHSDEIEEILTDNKDEDSK